MDIFLLMGQSNMAGRGLLEDVEPIRDERIRVFQDGRWTIAEEPLHHDRPNAGIGLAMSFARIGAGRPTPDGISAWCPGPWVRPPSNGGCRAPTSTKAPWPPPTRPPGTAASRPCCGTRESKTPSPKPTPPAMSSRFSAMVATLREQLDAPSLPVIVGELGSYLSKRPDFPHYRIVNAELRKVPDAVPCSAFINAEGLTDKGDSLHYDARSLRIFGERYAGAYLRLLDKTPLCGSWTYTASCERNFPDPTSCGAVERRALGD